MVETKEKIDTVKEAIQYADAMKKKHGAANARKIVGKTYRILRKEAKAANK